MPPATLSKRWKKGGFIKHLSGMTLDPLMAQSGVEKWISSLAASHASLSALPVSNWAMKIQDTYGLLLSESLARCNPESSSLRTCQVSLDGSYLKYSMTLPRWGIMLHGVLWGLPTLAHPIEGNGGLFSRNFATPCVMDSAQVQRNMAKESIKTGKWRGMDLKTTAMLIPTPTAGDHKPFNHHHQGGPGNLTLHGHASLFPTPGASDAEKSGRWNPNSKSQAQRSLVAMAKQNFPTPAARDWKGAYPRSKKGNHMGGLPDLVEEWKKTDGAEGSTNGGRLNPEWVAWLMGLPIGWIK